MNAKEKEMASTSSERYKDFAAPLSAPANSVWSFSATVPFEEVVAFVLTSTSVVKVGEDVSVVVEGADASVVEVYSTVVVLGAMALEAASQLGVESSSEFSLEASSQLELESSSELESKSSPQTEPIAPDATPVDNLMIPRRSAFDCPKI